MKIKIKSIKQVAVWKPETALAPWQDFTTCPAQTVAGSFKAAWESCRVDFEREVCFVIVSVVFSSSTGK